LVSGIEVGIQAGTVVSVELEELSKASLLLLFGYLGVQTGQSGGERHPVRRARARALDFARGLSLGLVAIVIFAGAEDLLYLHAFPEAGVLARLAWSLPVHLVAGLLEALGTVSLFRHPAGAIAIRRVRTWVGLFFWVGSLGLAAAWHLAANQLASGPLPFPLYLAGAVTAFLLLVALLSAFFRQAYLGGFLHGAE
jgi:hypothetical protein